MIWNNPFNTGNYQHHCVQYPQLLIHYYCHVVNVSYFSVHFLFYLLFVKTALTAWCILVNWISWDRGLNSLPLSWFGREGFSWQQGENTDTLLSITKNISQYQQTSANISVLPVKIFISSTTNCSFVKSFLHCHMSAVYCTSMARAAVCWS